MTHEQDRLATSVIIVNYRTKDLTLDAVRSALREPEVREILVVDNASGDGSADYLRAALPLPAVQVLDAPANLGFGRAVNSAVPGTSCDLVLLLNSDATIVQGGVGTLAGTLLADESVALVAPAVYEADGVTMQPGTYGAFPGPLGRPSTAVRRRVSSTSPDWVSGVAMMLRKDAFLQIGGFDADFEMYLEDVDLCRRLRDRGWLVLREPSARVVHLGGKSWRSSADKRRHYQRSKITYLRKAGHAPAQLAVLQGLGALRVLGARIGDLRRVGHG